jgi:hypothetical protein
VGYVHFIFLSFIISGLTLRHFKECPLPNLSELLENPRIRETDSFAICVQIHSPGGPTIPQQPSVCYVPKDLLDGLEGSLDNPSKVYIC